MKKAQLKSYQFRAERESSWRRLEVLLKKCEKKGIKSLSSKELRELPQLYRAGLSSLSVARAISLDSNVVQYLEGLCTRTYLQVYSTKDSFSHSVLQFLLAGFPQLFRRYKYHALLSTCIIAVGSVIAFYQVLENPQSYFNFVDAQLAAGRGPASSKEQLLEVLYSGSQDYSLSAFSSHLFSHNSRVAMLCFALGIIPGIAVFYLLFKTGLMLGAFAAIHHQHGISYDFWSWILPHGITEIFAIILCGAGGLAIGQSMLFPGQKSRRKSVADTSKEVVGFVVAAIFMLFYAAIIEGFFRQLVQDTGIRYGVAGLSLVFWIGYLYFVGREKEQKDMLSDKHTEHSPSFKARVPS